MYKLWNRLFGWDYIYWQHGVNSGISRVFNDCNNKTIFYKYKSIGMIEEIIHPDQVFWLTCAPEKYMKREDNEVL